LNASGWVFFSGGGLAWKSPVTRKSLDGASLILVRSGPPGACVIE